LRPFDFWATLEAKLAERTALNATRKHSPITSLSGWCVALALASSAAAQSQAVEGHASMDSPGETAAMDSARLGPGISALVHEAYEQIHTHPELGNQEQQTRHYLLQQLTAAGIDHLVPSERAPTAVITLLDSGRPGPTLALRAEMDARETTENPLNSPRSAVEGLMHNCGHDVHAAMLLGAAVYLHKHPEMYFGKLLVIFQPAEEIRGGANDIVDEGILETQGVDAIIAQHVASNLPVGTVSVSPGAHLAGSNYFTLNVLGNGSHAALPSGGGDTVVAAAKLIAGLSELPARRLDIIERPVIISPTAISSNTQASNVIPTRVEVRGTIRAFEDLSAGTPGEQGIEGLIRSYLDGASRSLGVDYELEIRKGSPPTVNDPALYRALVPALQRDWHGRVLTDDYRGMFSEDFSYYTSVVPALYFSIGVARDGFGQAGVHSPDFNVHPAALDEGTALLISLARIYSAHCKDAAAESLCGTPESH